MKKTNNDLELLSSYIDGELSQSEKLYLEEKIKTSIELQNQLAKLKKLKSLTSGSFAQISDSPYFETRVLATINQESKQEFSIRKWLPVTAIVLGTIGLMILLKFNPNFINNLIEEQKTNITGFYKENLQPLLYAANLSNEDIFNFAFYQQLPLDSTNQQVLKLGYDPQGTEYFEIKNIKDVAAARPGVNFKQFINVLEFDEKETKQIDSIIGSYSEQLSSLVLVNGNNAVAINPNIWNTRKAILADIIAFAQMHSAQKLDKLIQRQEFKFDNESIAALVSESKSNKGNQYIFCTPDSIFKEDFEFDMVEYKENMKKMEIELRKLDKEVNRFKDFTVFIDSNSPGKSGSIKHQKQFRIYADTDFVKVTVQNLDIPDLNIPELNLPDFDSIAMVIEEATKNVVTVRPPDPPSTFNNKKYNFQYNTKNKTTKKKSEVNLDSLMNLKNKIIDSVQSEILKGLEKKNDSPSNRTSFYFSDSLMLQQNNELKKEMDNLKKELRKFREEIKNLEQNKEGSNPKDIKEIKSEGIRVIKI